MYLVFQLQGARGILPLQEREVQEPVNKRRPKEVSENPSPDNEQDGGYERNDDCCCVETLSWSTSRVDRT